MPAAAGAADNFDICRLPMQMLLRRGDRTVDPDRVEFEDREPLDAARKIHDLFADGTPLLENEESRLGDYVILAPTADPRFAFEV